MGEESSISSGRGSTSLARAIAIMTTLGSPAATGGDGLGVSEIARLIGREKSQVSRTLKSLAEAGFVTRDPESLRYRLGWRLFALAATAGDQKLLTSAPQALRHLVARIEEAAHLSVLEGREVLTLMSMYPARAIQAAPWIGRAAPLHCTSSGRALLFDHSDAEVRVLLEGAQLPAGGPDAPRDIEEVLKRLSRARQLGYVLVTEEFEQGHVAVAAPVRDFRRHVIAALNISAPKFRLGKSLPAVGREIKAVADLLSRALSEGGALPNVPPQQMAPVQIHRITA